MNGQVITTEDKYELRKRAENLQPVGRMYIDNYEQVRVDSKTIKLEKPKGFKLSKKEKIELGVKKIS